MTDDPMTTASDLTRLESELLASEAQVAALTKELNAANNTVKNLKTDIARGDRKRAEQHDRKLRVIKERDALTERCAELEAALKDVEWIARQKDDEDFCPQCFATFSHGHFKGCTLENSLRPAPGAEKEEKKP